MTSTQQVIVPNRYRVIPRTIIFVFNKNRVLLQKGSVTKKINSGLWNGLGGHIEKAEDIITSANRELWEEAKIKCKKPKLCGTIMIDVQDKEGILLFVFGSRTKRDDFIDSEEGKLAWFTVDQLPKNEIVDDVHFLIAKVLDSLKSDKQFHLLYRYDFAGNRVISEFEN